MKKRFLAALIAVLTVFVAFPITASAVVLSQSVVFTNMYSLSYTTTIKYGEKLQLKAAVLPNNSTNKKIVWSSSNPDVVSVAQNGIIQGKAKEGTAVITAKASDKSGASASCMVTIGVRSKQFAYETSHVYLDVGEEDAPSYVMLPENTTNKNVMYRSSDKSIATVTQKGVITAVGKGTCRVYAAGADHRSKAGYVTVVVEEPPKEDETPEEPEPSGNPNETTLTITQDEVKNGQYFMYDTFYSDLVIDNKVSGVQILMRDSTIFGNLTMKGLPATISMEVSDIGTVDYVDETMLYGQSLRVGANSRVTNVKAKRYLNVSLYEDAVVESVSLSPVEKERIDANLEGFKGTLVVDNLNRTTTNVSFNKCRPSEIVIQGERGGTVSFTDGYYTTINSIASVVTLTVPSTVSMGLYADTVFITDKAKESSFTASKGFGSMINTADDVEVVLSACDANTLASKGKNITLSLKARSTAKYINTSGENTVVSAESITNIGELICDGAKANIASNGIISRIDVNGSESTVAAKESSVRVGADALSVKVNGVYVGPGTVISKTDDPSLIGTIFVKTVEVESSSQVKITLSGEGKSLIGDFTVSVDNKVLTPKQDYSVEEKDSTSYIIYLATPLKDPSVVQVAAKLPLNTNMSAKDTYKKPETPTIVAPNMTNANLKDYAITGSCELGSQVYVNLNDGNYSLAKVDGTRWTAEFTILGSLAEGKVNVSAYATRRGLKSETATTSFSKDITSPELLSMIATENVLTLNFSEVVELDMSKVFVENSKLVNDNTEKYYGTLGTGAQLVKPTTAPEDGKPYVLTIKMGPDANIDANGKFIVMEDAAHDKAFNTMGKNFEVECKSLTGLRLPAPTVKEIYVSEDGFEIVTDYVYEWLETLPEPKIVVDNDVAKNVGWSKVQFKESDGKLKMTMLADNDVLGSPSFAKVGKGNWTITVDSKNPLYNQMVIVITLEDNFLGSDGARKELKQNTIGTWVISKAQEAPKGEKS